MVNDKAIVRQTEMAEILSNAAQFQGFIKFVVPEVINRTIAHIKLGIFNDKGICIEHNTMELELFLSAKSIITNYLFWVAHQVNQDKLQLI